MVSGWIILDKPTMMFSRTAGAKVAHMLKTKTFGHIGTLDELASGVLPIAFGGATKMIPFVEDLSDGKKEYLFSMQFGFGTDTLDILGKEIAKTNFIPTEQQVKDCLKDFIGDIKQVPPAYSAVHIKGRRAYDLARAGQNIDMPERQISIYSLDFLGVQGKSWHFRVVCSRGTYVRALARDIARTCGTLATVDMIRRTKTNGFDIKDAVKLDFLEKVFNNSADFKEILKPIDLCLGGIPVISLDEKSAVLYKNGGFIKVAGNAGLVRVYTDKQFIGIGQISDGVLRPKRTI